ncbi:MAG: hypothetical protein M3322_09870 [Actinomycetota bacterium]|nr:hypothetical protein [Actinomycetota bacterium]
MAIAKRQVRFRPDRVQVRLFRRGLQSRPFWAVSLATVNSAGRVRRAMVVVVDARSGRVDSVEPARR